MKTVAFDPRDTEYKKPFGAVEDGTEVAFCIKLHKDALAHAAFLLLRRDSEDGYTELQMERETEPRGDFFFYSAKIKPSEGLYFYRFRFLSYYGEKTLGRAAHSEGEIGSLDEWQLTVYERGFATPRALSGGIIYQIFPDRFYSSGSIKKNVPADRCIRTDIGGMPEYRQRDDIRTLGNDYFRGDLDGIAEKLPYLHSLGVSLIYLNPIFEAHSNHRYNTADYMKVDPMLGDTEALRRLCAKARGFGIGVILDGVFSHTGDDSRYFNRYGRYRGTGAAQSPDSEYRSWYNFTEWPEASCWWGVPSLPETNELDPSFLHFITGENGVIRHWLRCGVSGFRLDVADELPDSFLDAVRTAVKAENPDALLLGEVWEDASNKISYGARRRFLRGRQLDSVMNYPFADAIKDFLKGGDARDLIDLVLDIEENYPAPALDLMMNHIGTHDTARILTALGGADCRDRETQAATFMDAEQLSRAKRLLRLAALLQYTLPGLPSLYYGDEAGLTGYGDPFCRACYPWGGEDETLLSFYRHLGKTRRSCPAFASGRFIPLDSAFGYVSYIREGGDSAALIAVNRWCDGQKIAVPAGFDNCEAVFGHVPEDGVLTVEAEDICLLVKR